MPTYTNDSGETRVVKDINDTLVHVADGDSVQTYDFLNPSDWTETSAYPIYNPVIASTSITLSAPGASHTLNTDTSYFIITEISDTVSKVFNEDATITPPLFENLSLASGFIAKYENTDKRCRKILLQGTGTCKVVEYR